MASSTPIRAQPAVRAVRPPPASDNDGFHPRTTASHNRSYRAEHPSDQLRAPAMYSPPSRCARGEASSGQRQRQFSPARYTHASKRAFRQLATPFSRYYGLPDETPVYGAQIGHRFKFKYNMYKLHERTGAAEVATRWGDEASQTSGAMSSV